MRFLPGCLDSLAGHVSEVVVVDTGSVDGSDQFAAHRGARVFHVPWTQDFSAARNAALDRATSDWILYIDADERLSAPSGRLEDLVDPAAVGMHVRFRPKLRHTPYLELRLFRSDPRIRFEGVIHESMGRGIDRVMREDGGHLADCIAELQHLGYEGDQGAKHLRNGPLLSRAIDERPGRVFLYQHRAEVLAAEGDIGGAVESCRTAMAIARRDGSAKQRADACIACQTLAGLLIQSGQDPLSAIREGLELWPHHRALQLLEARALLKAGDAAGALALADALRRLQPDQAWDRLIAYDERIFGEYAHEVAGAALLKLGRRDEARDAFAAAAEAAPDDLSFRVKAIALGAQF
jgi:tetratricopeptide (TPR) repeat protein